MTWNSYHNRGEILRTVTAVADQRRDGLLPTEVAGVDVMFDDELDLLGALQLKWHTRLAGRIERKLGDQPLDLESAVIDAWRAAACDLPGTRLIIDHYRSHPTDSQMAAAMAKSHRKEQMLLAVTAGRAGVADERGTLVGAGIEARARETLGPLRPVEGQGTRSLLGRIRAALAA